MSSFLEKLKKGMQDKIVQETPEEDLLEMTSDKVTLAAYKKKIPNDSRKSKIITKDNLQEIEKDLTKFSADKITLSAEEKTAKKISKIMAKKPTQSEIDSEWLNNEGQLAIDVYQTENDLVIQAAIAGTKIEDLDVLIEDEVITIKGNRPNPLVENGDYFINECYWGNFSRKIILPVEVDTARAEATMRDGILIIRIPKIQREKKKKLVIK